MNGSEIIMFLISSMFGLFLAYCFFIKKPLNVLAAMGHGMFVSSGLTLLITSIILSGFLGLSGLSLILFFIAACFGVTLVLFHVNGRMLSRSLVIWHAGLAVSGEIILLINFFKRG